MRAPRFWYRKRGVLSYVLTPLSWIWRWQTSRRLARQGRMLDVPVICLGNINIGGTGKTPAAIYLVSELSAMGYSPVILSRGYGGKIETPIEVTPEHEASEVGDEALLLANFAPVVIARDRAKGGRFASKLGDVIIMDDGFQNPSLEKDISVLVIDSDMAWGNGCVIPAGPLREPVAEGIMRADIILAIGKGRKLAEIKESAPGKPVITAELVPIEMGMNWAGKRLFAFAGIGRPEKFFDTLRGQGADLVATREFGDHQEIPFKLLERMEREAQAMEAQLITTEKDSARLPREWQGRVLSLPVRLKVTNGDLVKEIRARL